MSVKNAFRIYRTQLRKYNDQLQSIADQYHRTLFCVKMDALRCYTFYGAPVSQYIGFGMYKMNRFERNQYITTIRTSRLEPVLNKAPAEEIETLGNKHLFNKAFNKYIHRDWLYTPDSTDDEIRRFLSRHEIAVAKPSGGARGEGVSKLDCGSALQEGQAFIDRARAQKLILEVFVRQHPDLSAVNPSSLNTLRISTLRDKQGVVHVIGASLRAGGAGSVVDNLHAGGVQYPVDVETGIVIRGGMTHVGKKGIIFHPSTHMKMIGFQIPNWEQVIANVKEAAAIPPHLRYIGWDVAVTEEGCEFIEANLAQGVNGMQQDGVGKYNIIMQYA
ncbi:MAG: hypothetical protein IJQ02_12050 [Oscillospiraceae bacterium]|nr:hypothetical protein [Oscillospiraceae bacterium]